ncbi:hypothetical protein HCN83_08660 [Bacillus luteus]|uniref:Competence protein ComGD n=2 Tax=Alkalicoccus luteus TaxID=1237094 RepID=A0A969TV58_9BACI|nr:hypothetical protein [Alkalicoccus luteus]NJP37656.1 hypothetical protein [Alkalicoccus luteus]
METMAGLALISVFVSIGVLTVEHTVFQLNKERVIHELRTDLLKAQHHAVYTGKEVNVRFSPDGAYQIRSSSGILAEKNHQGVSFQRLTLGLHEVAFLPNGNIRKFGQLRMEIDGDGYRIVFMIGGGRFYVEAV